MTIININEVKDRVTVKDIAAKLGLCASTVKNCLSSHQAFRHKESTVALVRKTAEEMGYGCGKTIEKPRLPVSITGKDGKTATLRQIAEAAGVSFVTVHRYVTGKTLHPDPRVVEAVEQMGYMSLAEKRAIREAAKFYMNTPFHSREEMVSTMRQLRESGYGNTEIARKCGVTIRTVRRNIGGTPRELALQNRRLGQAIRKQKNAARALWVRNKPIIEYNKKVKEHNELKALIERANAAMAQMEANLSESLPAVEQAAAVRISVPAANLENAQIAKVG